MRTTLPFTTFTKDRRRLYLLLAILGFVSAISVAISISLLYRAALEQQRARLLETVTSRAKMLEAVARYDREHHLKFHSSDSVIEKSFSQTLSQIREAHRQFEGFGETGEFALARREGDSIVFLLSHRGTETESPAPISIGSELAEPMRMALAGKAGSMVGTDYRGARVLAAFAPVAVLDVGVVAKINMTEVQEPFRETALIAGVISLLLVLIGVVLFYRVGMPIVHELETSKERLYLALEGSSDGIWDWDLLTDRAVVNDRWYTMLGYEPNEFEPVKENWSKLVHPTDLDEANRQFAAHVQGHLPSYVVEVRMRHKEGGWRWILSRGRIAERLPDGRPCRMSGTNTDVSPQREAKEALRQKHLELVRAQKMENLGSWKWELDSDQVSMSEQAAHILGLSLPTSGLVPMATCLSFFVPEDQPILHDALQEFCRNGHTLPREAKLVRPDGELRYVRLILEPLAEFDGQFTSGIGTIQDITERKRDEMKNQYQAYVLDNVSDAVISLDVDFFVKSWNQAAESMYGFSAEEAVGSPVLELVRTEFVDGDFESNTQMLLRDGSWSGEVVQFNRDGAPLNVRATLRLLRDEKGLATGTVILCRNVTDLNEAEAERRRLEAQVMQSEKLAGIGQLAAGVAHEINNPIGYISSNLGTMKRYLQKITDNVAHCKLADDDHKMPLKEVLEDFSDAIDESLEGAARVKEIVQNLRSFARTDSGKMQLADLNEGLVSTLSMVWNQLKYTCTVERELDDLPIVYCSPGQLNQVFMNLLVNAGQAIEGTSGKIRIRTWADEQNAYVAIRDSGRGIAAADLRRIFEAFYTTKPPGEGTGLGLSLAHDIVERHGGRIDVHSEVGVGTEFTVVIPLRGAPAETETVDA